MEWSEIWVGAVMSAIGLGIAALLFALAWQMFNVPFTC